jgi:hypothetical protein
MYYDQILASYVKRSKGIMSRYVVRDRAERGLKYFHVKAKLFEKVLPFILHGLPDKNNL